eukprot:Amastigsp_a340137_5.p2 type:complete len:169 gc:universal Amastigsp_a340137_5:330-836(+)
MPHAVRVVCDEREEIKGVPARRLCAEVEIPRKGRAPDHDVAPREPAQVAELGAELLVLDEEQRLRRLVKAALRSERNAKVKVEAVVHHHVGLDRVEVDEDLAELTEEVEARCHALATGDGVALGCGRANDLKELLSKRQMLGRLDKLPVGGRDHALEDVLVGRHGVDD